MVVKVQITFLKEYIYDDSFFVPFDEFVLSFEDAIELVNKDIAVITKVYNSI